MIKLSPGNWESSISDLRVEIIKVTFDSPDKPYVKVKLNLVNKRNGIIYERRRNYKLIKSKINHWSKVY
jgi:hypothetical protein